MIQPAVARAPRLRVPVIPVVPVIRVPSEAGRLAAASWPGAPGPDGGVGAAGSASHQGLSVLVKLLVLITSLALFAPSRAWVVFRWVGVAAPAQRRVRGMAHRVAVCGPARRDGCRGRATARMLRHNGSGCGFSGLSEMAAPSLQRPGR